MLYQITISSCWPSLYLEGVGPGFASNQSAVLYRWSTVKIPAWLALPRTWQICSWRLIHICRVTQCSIFKEPASTYVSKVRMVARLHINADRRVFWFLWSEVVPTTCGVMQLASPFMAEQILREAADRNHPMEPGTQLAIEQATSQIRSNLPSSVS